MAVGGGTKNNIWMQATSDFSNIEQVVSEKSTGASYGNAFLAALAVGAVSQRDITRWNPALSKIKTHHSALHAEKINFSGSFMKTLKRLHTPWLAPRNLNTF